MSTNDRAVVYTQMYVLVMNENVVPRKRCQKSCINDEAFPIGCYQPGCFAVLSHICNSCLNSQSVKNSIE